MCTTVQSARNRLTIRQIWRDTCIACTRSSCLGKLLEIYVFIAIDYFFFWTKLYEVTAAEMHPENLFYLFSSQLKTIFFNNFQIFLIPRILNSASADACTVISRTGGSRNSRIICSLYTRIESGFTTIFHLAKASLNILFSKIYLDPVINRLFIKWDHYYFKTKFDSRFLENHSISL